MKIMGLLASALGLGLATPTPVMATNNGCFGNMKMPSKKERFGLPRGYPGAKMARAAETGRIGIKHLGLRADHVPVRQTKKGK